MSLEVLKSLGPYFAAILAALITLWVTEKNAKQKSEESAKQAAEDLRKLQAERETTANKRDLAHALLKQEVDFLKIEKEKSSTKMDQLYEGFNLLSIKVADGFGALGAKIDSLKGRDCKHE